MKFFVGLNPWMLPLAAAASFIFGGIWYGVLSKPWIRAAKLSEDQIRGTGGPSPAPFIITFVAQTFMAWLLAGLMLHMAKAGIVPNLRNGMIIGLFMWAGFVMTTLIVNHRFQMQSWALTLIDGGHWLGVLMIQGAILGMWGMA